MGLERHFMEQRKLTLGLQRELWKKNRVSLKMVFKSHVK